jgi:hypothetical protein
MNVKQALGGLLAGGMVLGSVAGAAPVRAASRPAVAFARPAATTPRAAATAAITAVPTTINRGGVIAVSGAGFAPNETVTLTLNGINTRVLARANASGLLPATGISIPYSTALGAATITATGRGSKRRASTTVTVQQLTPTISLSAPTAAPGARETVTGQGFGRRERVTLSLNGQALPTAAPIVTSNGAFVASFTVPGSIRRGDNTVSAIGNQSRVSAVAALTGNLPLSTQFYMAGGLNTAAESSNIVVLNTNKQSARVGLIFYYQDGAAIPKTVSVAGHATALFVVSTLGLPQGTFGVAVRADRQVAAELEVARYNHTDGDAIPGSSGLSLRWYLAAGSTIGGAETISILNPSNTRAAHVQLQLLGAGGASRTVNVTAPPHTNYVADLNALAPNQAVGVVALSDAPVLVERTQIFGASGAGLTTRAGVTTPAAEWLFAAGTTANGVRTEYTVLNPGDAPATVTASFYAQTGGSLGSRTVGVGPRSRITINLGDVAQGDRIAAVVTSDQAVVVERSEYTGSFTSAKSGSVVFGTNGAGVRWTFPAGDTTPANGATPGNNEALVLFNPSAVTVVVKATFYDSAGKVLTQQYTIAPTAHTEVSVNTLSVGPLHGVVLQSGNGQGFIAEQGITTSDASTFRSSQGLAQ